MFQECGVPAAAADDLRTILQHTHCTYTLLTLCACVCVCESVAKKEKNIYPYMITPRVFRYLHTFGCVCACVCVSV